MEAAQMVAEMSVVGTDEAGNEGGGGVTFITVFMEARISIITIIFNENTTQAGAFRGIKKYIYLCFSATTIPYF